MKQGIVACPVHGDNETTPRCPDCRPYMFPDPEELWFNTPDTHTLCRAGGNGPQHPSQLYAIFKYLPLAFEDRNTTFLDYGAGSGTTYEAMKNTFLVNGKKDRVIDFVDYTGVDIIPKNTEWCRQQFPNANWKYNPSLHKIDQPDQSFDVVYSRHVVDHMESFEKAMDEHKRVAKKLVIVILWTGLLDSDEHQIKNIFENGKTYQDEYTNYYSRKKIKEYLTSDSQWELLELAENIGPEQGPGSKDVVIVLKRKNET